MSNSGKEFYKKLEEGKVVKHPGALRATAHKAGAITPEGTISKSWLKEKASAGGILGKRARLAETFSHMNHRRGGILRRSK